MSDTSFTDDIEQLLALERSRPDEATDLLDRLRDRLSTTLGPFDALASAGGDAKAASPRPDAAATATSAGSLAGTKIALVALGAFAVGAVSGAKWENSRTPPQPSVSIPAVVASFAPTRETEHALPTAAAITADAGIAIDISSLPLVKPASTATGPGLEATSATQKDGRDPLGAERTLIDVARTASSRGKMTEAMAALDEHATRFPRGALSEEREGLRIQLLIAQGRVADARTRAASFRKNFPTSLMLPAIDAQLAAPAAPSTP